VKEENRKAAAARRAVLTKRQSELSQQRADLDRQVHEIASELAGLV